LWYTTSFKELIDKIDIEVKFLRFKTIIIHQITFYLYLLV
jgi:hypothetical protein